MVENTDELTPKNRVYEIQVKISGLAWNSGGQVRLSQPPKF